MGGPQKQPEKTLGPPFCPAWVGNQGRPREVAGGERVFLALLAWAWSGQTPGGWCMGLKRCGCRGLAWVGVEGPRLGRGGMISPGLCPSQAPDSGC